MFLAIAITLAIAPLSWAAAGIAIAIVGVGEVISPTFSLVVIALALPVGRIAPMPLGGIDVVDVLVLLALLGWLVRSLANRTVRVHFTSLLGILAVYLWATGLSLLAASDWLAGLAEWLKWLEFVVLYLVTAEVVSQRSAWWIVGALLCSGVVQVGLGVYQFVYQVGPEEFVLMGRFMRAYGTLNQPNPYAGYLGYLFPVALALSIRGLERTWRRCSWRDAVISIGTGSVALALASGIGISWSRGGWMGLLACSLVVIACRSSRIMVFVGMIVLVVTLLLFVFRTAWLPQSLSGRLQDMGTYVLGPDPTRTEVTDANFAVLERLAHWDAGWRMFMRQPWSGVGIGNFAANYPKVAPPPWYEALGHAHNIYINFLAETGIIGAFAFIGVWVRAAWLAWKESRRQSGYSAALALGLLGTLAYLSVHNVFDNLFVQHMQLQLALLLGAVAALSARATAAVTRQSHQEVLGA